MRDPDIDLLRRIDQGLIERYRTRLEQFGDDPRTLGWDRKENQATRFRIACQEVDVCDRSVLDVGCGLADFLTHLNDSGNPPGSYCGLDINPELLEVCRRKYPDSEFIQGNLLYDSLPNVTADIVVMFGVLNLRFAEMDNLVFARRLLTAAYRRARVAFVFDMLTRVSDPAYPREDFVHYYDPSLILGLALQLTPHVTLRHDYRSIPQREMMLVLRKNAQD
jgi:SAM-dependent methyltransferase